MRQLTKKKRIAKIYSQAPNRYREARPWLRSPSGRRRAPRGPAAARTTDSAPGALKLRCSPPERRTATWRFGPADLPHRRCRREAKLRINCKFLCQHWQTVGHMLTFFASIQLRTSTSPPKLVARPVHLKLTLFRFPLHNPFGFSGLAHDFLLRWNSVRPWTRSAG